MNDPSIASATDRQVMIAAGLASAVGDPGRLTTDPAMLAHYTDDLSATREKHLPIAAVKALSREEVQAVVNVANRFSAPLTAYSAGFGLGTALPRKDGILLDLRDMNGILEINEGALYVLVEPGVTFEQIGPVLAKRGLAVSVPDAPPQASVLANHLNFGVGSLMMQRGLGPDLVLGLEAVLPTGDIVRTGSAMREGGDWFGRYAFSPVPDLTGLFLGAFGATGVVTKLAIRVFPRPQAKVCRKFGFATVDAAARAIKEVVRLDLADRVVGYNWLASPEVAPALDARIDGKPLSEGDLATFRATAPDVPECFFYFGVHGVPAVVDVRASSAERIIIESHGGRPMELSAVEQERLLSVADGRAHDLALRAVQRRKGRYQNAFHIFYALVPVDGVARLYDRWSDIGLQYGHPFTMNMKCFRDAQCVSLHFLMNYFDRTDPKDRKRISDLCEQLDQEALKAGAIGKAAAKDEFLKSLSSYALLKLMKSATDPNGIM